MASMSSQKDDRFNKYLTTIYLSATAGINLTPISTTSDKRSLLVVPDLIICVKKPTLVYKIQPEEKVIYFHYKDV